MSFLFGAGLGSAIPDSGLEHRYDAKEQTSAAPLIDQEGSNDLSASGSPQLQSNINGNNSIFTDGSNELYSGTQAPIGPNGEYTVAFVGRVLDTGSFQYSFANGSVDGYAFAQDGSSWVVFQDNNTSGGSQDTSLHTFILTYDGSNTILEVDNSQVINTSSLGTPSPRDDLSIGGDVSQPRYQELEFGEFLIYSVFKTSAERQGIYNYLQRWF